MPVCVWQQAVHVGATTKNEICWPMVIKAHLQWPKRAGFGNSLQPNEAATEWQERGWVQGLGRHAKWPETSDQIDAEINLSARATQN